jgi:hypothetical protein
MAMFQVTCFMENVLTAVGWTEPWYISAGDYAAAKAAMEAVIPNRMGCATANTFLRALRVSDVTLRGDALIAVYGDGHPGTIDPTAHADAGPFDAVLVRKDTDPPIHHGFMYMRGWPEDVFVGRQIKANGFVMVGAGPSFFNSILAGTFHFRHLPVGQPVANATYPAITELTAIRRVSRRVGRPFDQLRGRRRIA